MPGSSPFERSKQLSSTVGLRCPENCQTEVSFHRPRPSYLLEAGVGPSDAVKPKDVQRLVVDEGYTLVDVRIQWSYDEWNLDYAVHMPLLRTIEGNDPAKIWRRFGYDRFAQQFGMSVSSRCANFFSRAAE